jgi:hypothetical protein
MMPAVDPREDTRKRRSRFVGIQAVVTILAATMLSESRFRSWVWVLGLVSFTIIIVFTTFFIDQLGPPYRRRRDAGSRPGRPGRPHRPGGVGEVGDVGGQLRGDARPAGPAPYQWRTLLMVSRLMPGAVGRRWLAEAESLLSEIQEARRGAAVRSYLRSAPRLTVQMWAHEVLQAVARSRRPG